MVPNRRVRPARDRHPPPANLALRPPHNASAHSEKTRAYLEAVHRLRPTGPPPAALREKFPAPSRHPPALKSKSDKAGADLVSLLRPPGFLRGNVTRLA